MNVYAKHNNITFCMKSIISFRFNFFFFFSTSVKRLNQLNCLISQIGSIALNRNKYINFFRLNGNSIFIWSVSISICQQACYTHHIFTITVRLIFTFNYTIIHVAETHTKKKKKKTTRTMLLNSITQELLHLKSKKLFTDFECNLSIGWIEMTTIKSNEMNYCNVDTCHQNVWARI